MGERIDSRVYTGQSLEGSCLKACRALMKWSVETSKDKCSRKHAVVKNMERVSKAQVRGIRQQAKCVVGMYYAA